MMDSFLHMIRSLRYSLEGLSRCFRDEIAFRQECLLAIPHFAGVLLFAGAVVLRNPKLRISCLSLEALCALIAAKGVAYCI